jgi:heterodisulfide reductase subunit C
MIGFIIERIAFFAAIGGAGYVAFKGFSTIYRNIMLGRKEKLAGNLNTMLLVAFGQKKMFKRPVVAVLHFIFYVAFIVTQIELLEIMIDGAFGTHRFVYHLVEHIAPLRALYVCTVSSIEVLSLLTFFVTIIFFIRRDMLKIPRLASIDLEGWPNMDAHLILLMEINLIVNIFLMNTADMAASNGEYGLWLSGIFSGAFAGWDVEVLHILEKVGWWGHLAGVLGFLMYLSISKHLHILLAFPNTYFSRQTPKGYMDNMESVTREVKLMMDPNAAVPESTEEGPVKFGAKDVTDLSWKNLLDAYTCTECGRCTAQCPANITGKKLSPRTIMMKTRDRLEEVGKNIDANGGIWKDDGKSLIDNGYISVEELRACTTCNACVEECPVNISPLNIILQLRRNLIMEDSNSPAEWNGMFANLENNAAPWQFSQQDRFNWAKEQ